MPQDNSLRTTSLLDYLDALGYRYQAVNADEYTNIEAPDGHPMSSFKYNKSKNTWMYHAGGYGGYGAWDYVKKIEGITSPKDIEERLRDVLGVDDPEKAAAIQQITKERREREELQAQYSRISDDGTFHLPPQSPTTNELRTALCGRRGIDREVLEFFIDRGIIYESNEPWPRPDGTTMYFHNAVFVARDKTGTARAASYKYLQPKRDKETGREYFPAGAIAHSDHQHYLPAYFSGSSTNMLCLFESVIDALAFLTLQKQKGRAWDSFSFVSFEGISADYKSVPNALKQILDERSDIERIVLAFDNDDAGMGAANSLKALLERGRYQAIVYTPPKTPRTYTHGKDNFIKDWCDLCTEHHKAVQAQSAVEVANALVEDAMREKN
ncbi:MAG: toprim domain-containing protein [Saccharofermentans sp.]|nr:toprim domain-containing protein [Saccharofermentans sp.]